MRPPLRMVDLGRLLRDECGLPLRQARWTPVDELDPVGRPRRGSRRARGSRGSGLLVVDPVPVGPGVRGRRRARGRSTSRWSKPIPSTACAKSRTAPASSSRSACGKVTPSCTAASSIIRGVPTSRWQSPRLRRRLLVAGAVVAAGVVTGLVFLLLPNDKGGLTSPASSGPVQVVTHARKVPVTPADRKEDRRPARPVCPGGRLARASRGGVGSRDGVDARRHDARRLGGREPAGAAVRRPREDLPRLARDRLGGISSRSS